LKKTIFIGIMLTLCTAPAFAKFDPEFIWTTRETPHFLIHYHQGGEAIAERAAQIAEEVHDKLVPRVQWEPKEKTQVVLVDAMDEANGMTTPFPYNLMVLFLTQPVGAPGFGTTSVDDWLRLLITHEYTHTLQLDMVQGGFGGVMQAVFGRLYFPNLFQPIWLIEGLAVHEETELTGGGRGRSPGADMVLRMASLEGPFPTLGQMAVYPDTWPSGQVPYLFGDSFITFIADRFGRERLADVSVNYSKRGFPFLVDSTAQRSLGEGYDRLYQEWKDELRVKYFRQHEAVKDRGVTVSTALTHKGYNTLAPAWSPDGTRIAYLEANGDEFPGIYIMQADGTNNRKLVENVFPTSAGGMTLAWSADSSRLYYTKIEVRGTNYYDDLYAYDLNRRKEQRLTRKLRARDPHPSPDGKQLVFVMNRLGMTRLALLDLAVVYRQGPATEKDITFLTEASDVQYEAPRWSPDGTKIAVSIRQAGGYQDIWVLDREGKKLDEVTHDRAIEGAPAWSPDGRFLYFASDRTGIFNLYAYELGSKNLSQMTNVLGGAFSPAPSPDDTSMAFTSYSASGYDIHATTIDRANWKPAEPYRNAYPVVPPDESKRATTTKPYSPLPTLAPRFWFPIYGYSEESSLLLGGLTMGVDATQQHQYIAQALYGPARKRLWYSLDYFYDGWYPTFHLHASDADATYTDLLANPAATASADYVERQRILGAQMIVDLVKTAVQQSLSLGFWRKDLSHRTDLAKLPGFGPRPAEGDLLEGVLGSARFGYQINTARRYDFSISPEQGSRVALGCERFDRFLGSDLEFTKCTADWHQYINFPWPHQVLQARAFVGASKGERLAQGAFQMGGEPLGAVTPENPGDAILGLDDLSTVLRGYPENAFRGSKAGLLSLEYRFPISNLEKGFSTKPLFLRRLHGAVFAETGNVWDNTFHRGDLKSAAGAEARLDVDLGYSVPATFRIGIARGFDEKGETRPYIGIWLPLEL